MSYLLSRLGFSQYAVSLASCLMTTPYAGQIAPAPRPARARVLHGLLVALVASVFVACGLLVLAIIGSDTGFTGVLVGLALAAVPVFVVVPAFLWLDRFEAEPTGLLLFAFGWGAAVATLIAILVNSTSIALLKASGGDVTAGVLVVAPIVEETCKGGAVLLVFLYRRREFDGVVDGIVYAGMAGIGFAFHTTKMNICTTARTCPESGLRRGERSEPPVDRLTGRSKELRPVLAHRTGDTHWSLEDQ